MPLFGALLFWIDAIKLGKYNKKRPELIEVYAISFLAVIFCL